MIHKPNFYVLTGGPGVGKTTLLRHLAARGELTVEENARAVIREEAAAGGRGVPWLDNERFVALTTARDVADFDAETIARKALDIAADICIYTNRNVTLESL